MMKASPKSYSLFLSIALSAAVLGLVPVAMPPAYAQSQQALTETQKQEIRKRLERTGARLDLTDQQKEEVVPILRANAETNLRILQRYGISRDNRPDLNFRQKLALRRDLSEQREETNERLAGILSRDQMRIMEQIQEENRERMRERFQG